MDSPPNDVRQVRMTHTALKFPPILDSETHPFVTSTIPLIIGVKKSFPNVCVRKLFIALPI